MYVNKKINENLKLINKSFPKKTCADFVIDEFLIAGRRAFICCFNGSTNSELLLRVQEDLMLVNKLPETVEEFAKKKVALTDKRLETNLDNAITAILSAMSVLFIDGYNKAIILDTKEYPSRSIEEPEKNKTMRGPRDGFCESVFINTALIRRRIKSTALSFESFEVGTDTKTKVILSYMKGKCDDVLLKKIRNSINELDILSLTLTQQTLSDKLFSKSIWSKINPFPKVRYVERPDTAASMLIEGKIGILCDTSPSVIFVPVNIYDMVEETDDYYFPPFTASYLRILRICMLFVSVFLSPLWLLAIEYASLLPKSLEFLLVDSNAYLPVWLQLITVELMIDALKIASLNTPNTISNSLSVVSGLLLSDFAVSAGWLVPQTILYSAVSSIANFIPTNYELGYAFKFWRITLISFTAIFGFFGLVFAMVLFILIMVSNRTESNKGFLFPFVPKSKRGILKLFIRTDNGKEKD